MSYVSFLLRVNIGLIRREKKVVHIEHEII